MEGLFGPYTGHAAGISTSLLWTATSLFFTAAAKRIGPVALNAFRLVCAVVLLGAVHRVLHGHWMPDTVPKQLLLLAFSGFVGLTIGDQVLFVAFLDIGPRLSMLIMTTAPIVAAVLGWIVLGERLEAWAMIGIAMTVGGVAWVVLERPRGRAETPVPLSDDRAGTAVPLADDRAGTPVPLADDRAGTPVPLSDDRAGTPVPLSDNRAGTAVRVRGRRDSAYGDPVRQQAGTPVPLLPAESPTPHRVRGIVMAVIAASCQAGGLMLSKVGMGHGWLDDSTHMDPQAATLVRMVFAALGMAPILAVRHIRRKGRVAVDRNAAGRASPPGEQTVERASVPAEGRVDRASPPGEQTVERASVPAEGRVDRASPPGDSTVGRASVPAERSTPSTASSGAPDPPVRRWSSGLAFAACGSVVGPFLGVWMSLVASDRVDLGIAQTLCSLPPVFILPFAAKLHGERIGPRAILGALIAVAGVAALMMTAD